MQNTIENEIRRLIQAELGKERPRIFPPLQPVPPFRLYSVKAAAEILDVSTEYIYSRFRDGSIQSIVDLGGTRGKYRIRADELQRFIEAQTSRTR